MLRSRRSYSVFIYSVQTLLRMRPSRKVFVIGLNKTGTTSLHYLLERLGYHANHSIWWSRSNLSLRLMMYDAFSDGNPRNFDVLDRNFPGSKFILNVRDLDSWLDSRLNHVVHIENNRPDLKTGGTWSSEGHAIRESILLRNKHNLRVLWHFADRPNDLLVVNFVKDPNAAQKIADFLGKDQTVEKPHANQKRDTDQSNLRFKEKIHKILTELNIAEEEWSYDLVCPSLIENPVDKNWVPDTSMRLD